MADPVIVQFNTSTDKAMKESLIAISKLGYSLKSIDKEYYIINFETGPSMYSFSGQNMSILFNEIDVNTVQINISGTRKPQKQYQITDWGEAKKIGLKIIAELKSRLGQNEPERVINKEEHYKTEDKTPLKSSNYTKNDITHTRMNSKYWKIIFPIIIILVLIVCIQLLINSFNHNDSNENKVSSNVTEKDPSEISSIEDAQKYIIGSWSFTSQYPGSIWSKYIFYSDGSYDEFAAMPIDNNWSHIKKGSWQAGVSKYVNTGEKFYYVGINRDETKLIGILDHGNIKFQDMMVNGQDMIFWKGEK